MADQSHKAGLLQINLAFQFIVAWRIHYTTMLCRETPDISCEVAFEEAEWKALWCHQYKTHQLPDSPPSLQEVTLMLARLGGYKQWQKNMLPGPQNLAKGDSILSSISTMWNIMNAKEQTESLFLEKRFAAALEAELKNFTGKISEFLIKNISFNTIDNYHQRSMTLSVIFLSI